MSSETPARPKPHEPQIILAAAKMLVPQVMEWLKPDEADPEEVASHIAKCARGHVDGYAIAREMDDYHGYGVDAELVEILDMMIFRRGDAHSASVAEWVKANNIQPKYSVGDRVRSERFGAGEIVEIRMEHARYGVKLDDRAKGDPGYVCSIFDYEDVIRVEEAEIDA